MQINNYEFWEYHILCLKKRKTDIEIERIFNDNFKNLINGMLEELPDKRFTLD